MEKYLFTDGTNEVREAQSKEELDSFIAATADTASVRIWLFSTCEWVSYADFTKKGKRHGIKKVARATDNTEEPLIPQRRSNLLKRFIFFTLAGTTVFLVYNFTRIRWEKVQPLQTTASRPANVPMLNADSLLLAVEAARGQKLDKTTRTNLRIRNTWPELITLQLQAYRDTAADNSRFRNIELSIDNSTGYHIDEAIVNIIAWKQDEISSTDTFHISGISYAQAAKRIVEKTYRCDSLSVSFEYIRARRFNFCYSADKKSNYGNAADRWYCRE